MHSGIESGTKLGRYEIISKIGAGGMGEVYLAQDKQLDRKVALKLLLPEFCCDLERVQRFKLEAKAASALNHPNIITIHEIDEFDERVFITTEFVDGETVREKIKNRELTVLESLKIAEQIADALAVAHEEHIIHRDIKPENIMLRKDGYAKILDFGLAKPIPHGTEDETIQLVKTQPGLVMGSVRYMSPEQARGKETDERTDIWSLGVVLYEMLTGKNPFEGETISDSLAALIHVEVSPIEDAPEELNFVLRKALRKNMAERYQTIRDFSIDLKEVRTLIELHHSLDGRSAAYNLTTSLAKQDTSENVTLIHQTQSAERNTGERGTQSFGWRRSQTNSAPNGLGFALMPLVAVALMAITALGAFFYLPSFFGSSVPIYQSIQVSRKTDNGKAQLATVSPDGKLVAFVDMSETKPKLVVRQLATDSTIPIVPPVEKGFLQPTFSPDGEFIYYVQKDNGVGTLYKVPKLGGSSKEIVVDIDSRAAFSPDGKKIAFSRHNPTDGGDTIFIIDSEGQNLKPFIDTKTLGFNAFMDVVWSEDGSEMLLSGHLNDKDSFEKVTVLTVKTDDSKEHSVPEFLASFNNENWKYAANFIWLKNKQGLVFIGKKATDDAIQIWHLSFKDGAIKQVTTDTSDYESISSSNDGNTLVATKVDRISSLVSYIPETNETRQLTSESKTFLGYSGISQMPNGDILFPKRTGKEVNIFSIDKTGGNEKQLTSESGFNFHPVVTSDGKYIVFTSHRNETSGIWRMDADGKNQVQLTNSEDSMDMNPQISKDGKTVYFTSQKSDGGKARLMKVSIEGGNAEPLLPESKSSDSNVEVSPDGKKIAYQTYTFNEKTINLEVSVKIAEIEANKITDYIQEIEFEYHKNFQWSPDGESLTFVNPKGDDNIWKISTTDKKETQITKFNSGNILNFLWSNDGKSLFIVRGIMNSDLVLIRDIGNS
jgi:serine/threonine protein kinase/Tol biopolymer transport system component